MDLAQLLMFQQLGQQLPSPMVDKPSPIADMMRGPANEDNENVLQLKKLQLSGTIPSQPPAAQDAYEKYASANMRGLEAQRTGLAELEKLVKANQPDVNPLQNLFQAAHDTVAGDNKRLTALQAAQQGASDKFLTQNEALQKGRGDISKHEIDLAEAEMKNQQQKTKDQRDREQFKLLYGLKAQNADNSSDNKVNKQEQNLFTDWTKNAVTKASQDVATAYEKVTSAATDPSAAGDMSLLFGYMKMLDPGSTVREGEFATAQQAGSIPQRVIARYNQLINGQRLEAGQRADFTNQAEKVFRAQLEQQKRWDGTIGERAKAAGVDPEKVVFGKKLFGKHYEAGTGFPRNVSNGKNSATVSNEAELEEAMKEGYK